MSVLSAIIQRRFNDLSNSADLEVKLREVALIDFYRRQSGGSPVGFVEIIENYLGYLFISDSLIEGYQLKIREKINDEVLNFKPSFTLMENSTTKEILKVITLTNNNNDIPAPSFLSEHIKELANIQLSGLEKLLFISVSINLEEFGNASKLWESLKIASDKFKHPKVNMHLKWFVPLPISFKTSFGQPVTYIFANYLYQIA
jgi:hypothetical protein